MLTGVLLGRLMAWWSWLQTVHDNVVSGSQDFNNCDKHLFKFSISVVHLFQSGLFAYECQKEVDAMWECKNNQF